MPLVYQQNINAWTKIGVWSIQEEEVFFLRVVSLQNDISHPHKRLQHLAGRYLLKLLFPNFPLQLIEIADTRKPFLASEDYHFSISHCGDYAAVIVSTENRVGVDIEIPQIKIRKISHKFLTPEEQLLLELIPLNHLHSLCLAWSIKEAIFKWYGEGQVDFRRHMRISTIKECNFDFVASCFFQKEETISLEVFASMFNGISLAYLVS